MRSIPVRATAALLALAAFLGLAVIAKADLTFYEPGSNGWDVSWPQCDSRLPKGGEFAVVGVNGGKAFSPNPCLGDQLTWAEALPFGASVYVNTGNPGTLGNFWPTDIETCTGELSKNDSTCAAEYGRRSAEDAVELLTSAGGDPEALFWWLDVEVANSWEGSNEANVATIEAYIDYLVTEANVAGVGIYSTGYQWGEITGGYEFENPLPVWVAGARSVKSAPDLCDSGFAGGSVLLVQYFSKGFDGNLVCGGSSDGGSGGSGRPENPGRSNR